MTKPTAKQLKEFLDEFYESFEIDIYQPVPQSTILKRSIKNELIDIVPVGDLKIGKATVLKTGDSAYAIQKPPLLPPPPLKKSTIFYRPDDDDDAAISTLIIVLLSEKRPFDYELNPTTYDFNSLPYFQIVEDIYIPYSIFDLASLELSDLRPSGNLEIKEPYISFFNFLKQTVPLNPSSPGGGGGNPSPFSFRQYLRLGNATPNLLPSVDFIFDSEEDSISKLEILGIPLVFYDWGLPLRYEFKTATLKSPSIPFSNVSTPIRHPAFYRAQSPLSGWIQFNDALNELKIRLCVIQNIIDLNLPSVLP